MEMNSNSNQPADDKDAISKRGCPQHTRSGTVRFTINSLMQTQIVDEPTVQEALKADDAEK